MIARVAAIVIALLAIAGVGAGSYLLGHSAAPGKADVAAAREVAARDAFAESFATAHAAAVGKGERRGRRAGRAAGREVGTELGATAGSGEVERREGVSAAVSEQAASDVAAAEAAEAEALYLETHPWVDP